MRVALRIRINLDLPALVRARIEARNRRIRRRQREREYHYLIKETMVRAADDELKTIYNENDHGYDPKFEEAVIMCLEHQKRRM